jgi:hypothetical protein
MRAEKVVLLLGLLAAAAANVANAQSGEFRELFSSREPSTKSVFNTLCETAAY